MSDDSPSVTILQITTTKHTDMRQPYPTQERLHELFDLDEATGHLTWKVLKGLRKPGPIGSIDGFGYRNWAVSTPKPGVFRVARLVWIYVHGPIPPEVNIHHINGDRDDNRPANLISVHKADRMPGSRQLSNAGFKGLTRCGAGFEAHWWENGKPLSRKFTDRDAAVAFLTNKAEEKLETKIARLEAKLATLKQAKSHQ